MNVRALLFTLGVMAILCLPWRRFPKLPYALQSLVLKLNPYYFFERSNIPLFILDSKHCWLKDNKDWLERYPDVQKAICDKESALWREPQTPNQTLPEDLFGRLNIDNTGYGINRQGWMNAIERLREIRDCPAALNDIEHLHIRIYVYDFEYSGVLMKERTLPPLGLPELFVSVLRKMPNLNRLDWGIAKPSAHSFEKAFLDANITLPSVKFLKPAAYSDWLVPLCPDLEAIQAGAFSNPFEWKRGDGKLVSPISKLIRASGMVPLQEWRMDADWKLEYLEELLISAPEINLLHMDGSLDLKYHSYEDAPWEPREDLQEVLTVLTRFQKLRHLRTPYASELKLGLDSEPGCGNAYFGRGGRDYGRYRARIGAEVTELAAKMIMETLPNLETFSIGSYSPTIENGSRELVWPWTGRMKEYTFDIWPEPEDGEDGDGFLQSE